MNFNFDELVTKKNIILSYNGLRDEDLDVLIEVIKQSSALETLDLRHNKLTLADGKVTNAIAQSKIKVLEIRHNNIGVEGAKHLADALKVNKTINEIHLNWNNLVMRGRGHWHMHSNITKHCNILT